MEAENRNLIAVVGSAGISTEGLGPTELRAAALKANAFLATEYLTHSMQFALRTARERRKADELVHAWGRDQPYPVCKCTFASIGIGMCMQGL